MKATGIARKVDELGRIVVPVELRRMMDIGIKDEVEIFVEDDKIILKKYHPACVFCWEKQNAVQYKGKLICRACLAELRKL